MPTATTIPLILLLLYLWKKTEGRVLPAVVFTSVFGAASAIDVGSFGISCWLFTLISFGAVHLVRGHRPYRLTPGLNRTILLALCAFVAYAALSGFLFPLLFAGTMIVRLSTPEPLAWGMANVSQLCYLAAAVVIYLIAISSTRAELAETLEWYVRACVLAAVVAFYQLLNAVAHVPYPSAVLYSNKTYVIFPAYKLNGVWRLNSTFTEASAMAGFMVVGIALLGWTVMTRPLRWGRTLCFALMLLATLMTQSSVGYATLILLFVIGGIIYIRHLYRGGALSHGKVAIAIIGLAAIIGVWCVSGSAVDTVQKVVRATLFEKQNSDSYRDRALTHETALQTLSDTYYIGAGWGSIRASGLLYVLLGETGVLGLALFFTLIGSLFVPLFRRRDGSQSMSAAHVELESGPSLPAALFAILMFLVTMVAAGSELGDPMLWVLFGVMTVGSAPLVSKAHSGPLPGQTVCPNPFATGKYGIR